MTSFLFRPVVHLPPFPLLLWDLTCFCNMLTCQASKVGHRAVRWSRGERGLISRLLSSPFWL